MASRRISRAVGATSLEIKCLFLFGVFLLVVMAFSLYLYWRVTEDVVYEQHPVTADGLVDHLLLQVHWEGLETADAEFKKHVDGLIADFADKLSDKGVEATFLYRPDAPQYPASGEGRPADERESEVIAYYMRAEGANTPYVDFRDEIRYYYYQPIFAKRQCLGACHSQLPPGGNFSYAVPSAMGVSAEPVAVGDLMAVSKITIPNESLHGKLTDAWTWLLAFAIVTAFLAMVAFYIVIRYVVVRPVRHLRDVSDAIAHGDINMRADIHTGDEFEALAVAYNRMLRHLVDAQDELRSANVNLDVKVDELAKLNMQLYETNRIKSDFMATMSHELRTPLNSILGFSDVLGSIDSLDSKQKRFVQNIQKSGRLLLEMINNVLDLAKVESGKMELRLTTSRSIG